MSQQLRAIFSGQVQGVGFRYKTLALSSHFAVKGYVQNLGNGTVELVAEGEKHELERFLLEVQQEMNANLENTLVNWHPATDRFQAFSIRR
ncbi:MAG: acylphosphatase [Planctomycetota bacterium]|nr:acylphosphatase [Planctomycetota bacterium]